MSRPYRVARGRDAFPPQRPTTQALCTSVPSLDCSLPRLWPHLTAAHSSLLPDMGAVDVVAARPARLCSP